MSFFFLILLSETNPIIYYQQNETIYFCKIVDAYGSDGF